MGTPEDAIFKKVCTGGELTQAESDILYASTGVRVPPTVTADMRGAMTEALNPQPEKPDEIIDLVTGQRVVNIPRCKVSRAQLKFIAKELDRAFVDAKKGPVDLRAAVRVCDTSGPFRGFASIFSPEAHARLGQADEELVNWCADEYCRLLYADITENIIRDVTVGLERHINPLLPEIHTQEARKKIEDVLMLWQKNLENPHRNFYKRTATHAASGEEVDASVWVDCAVPMILKNPQFFSIGALYDLIIKRTPGMYVPAMRALKLREPASRDYDFFEMLVVIHELTHVQQHNAFIEKYAQHDPGKIAQVHDTYASAFAASHCIADNEWEAYENMIELLAAKIGFRGQTMPEICSMIGMDPQDKRRLPSLRNVVHISNIYHRNGGHGHEVPEEFVTLLTEHNKRKGGDLVIRRRDFKMP